jgi:hypothetical protein
MGAIRALTALSALLLVGCSASTESAADREAALRMKAQCLTAGQRARADWVARYPNETFMDNPEYGYCPKLSTCLYADEYVDVNQNLAFINAKSRRDRFVLDVYSGRVLVEYTEWDGVSIQKDADPVQCRTEREFESRKAELFGVASKEPPLYSGDNR